jgi:hypothetical protein
LDEICGYGIGIGRENDRNGLGRRYCRPHADYAATCEENRDLTANEIGRHCRQWIELTIRPTILDGDVAALDEARFAQASIVRPFRRRHAKKRSDHWHRRLLDVRSERPRCRSTANQH